MQRLAVDQRSDYTVTGTQLNGLSQCYVYENDAANATNYPIVRIKNLQKAFGDNEVLKGEARINALGGFDMAFKLPATMNLGYANIQLDVKADGLAARNPESHRFQVQEFRRPEFEVNARVHPNVDVFMNNAGGRGGSGYSRRSGRLGRHCHRKCAG